MRGRGAHVRPRWHTDCADKVDAAARARRRAACVVGADVILAAGAVERAGVREVVEHCAVGLEEALAGEFEGAQERFAGGGAGVVAFV